jgi:hypothetical protein
LVVTKTEPPWNASKLGRNKAVRRCNRRGLHRKPDPLRGPHRRKYFMPEEPADRSPLKVPEAMPPELRVQAAVAEAVDDN